MKNVHVAYGFSGRARRALGFAAAFADRLRAELFVWIGRDAAAAALIESALSKSIADREDTHVRDRVMIDVGLSAPSLRPRFVRGNPEEAARGVDSVLVSQHVGRLNPGVAQLVPMDERAIEARGRGPICLPFGNGDSGRLAARAALPLAKALGLPLLLYHTTWKERALPATAPAEAHMTAGARVLQREIEAEASLSGVPCRALIETATAVVQGVSRAALNERCALIVMARGKNVERGSYADGVLARTTVPVFLTGRSD